MSTTFAPEARARLFDDSTRDSLPARRTVLNIATRLRAVLATERWVGAGVAFSRRPGGAVTAAVLGVTGIGPTEGAALLDLERKLNAAVRP